MDAYVDYLNIESGEKSKVETEFLFKGIDLSPDAKNYSNCDTLGSFYEITEKEKKTAFGYEHEDGSVRYVLCQQLSLAKIKTSDYLDKRELPKGNFAEKRCEAENFFSKTLFFDENTEYRILFSLLGSVLVKKQDGGAGTVVNL